MGEMGPGPNQEDVDFSAEEEKKTNIDTQDENDDEQEASPEMAQIMEQIALQIDKLSVGERPDEEGKGYRDDQLADIRKYIEESVPSIASATLEAYNHERPLHKSISDAVDAFKDHLEDDQWQMLQQLQAFILARIDDQVDTEYEELNEDEQIGAYADGIAIAFMEQPDTADYENIAGYAKEMGLDLPEDEGDCDEFQQAILTGVREELGIAYEN